MSLTTSLNIAVQSLMASTGALQITNNNIANANTPGYTREVAQFSSVQPTDPAQFDPGNGAVLNGFQSIRDELLEVRVQQETQSQGDANAQLSSLQQIEPVFTTSTQDIGTQMNALFGALSTLSTDPTSSSAREGVLTAGQNLATAFNNASNALNTLRNSLNKQVTQDVSQINQLTQQIAALNPRIADAVANGHDPGILQDQQDQLVLKLSKLTGISITSTESGISVTTGNGTPLVVGTKGFSLQTTVGSDGMEHVLDESGNDITTTVQGGDLGGTITTREQTIPGLLSQLDTLAYEFGNAFNAAQASGYDQNGNVGGNFFNVPASAAGAAGSISMATTNPALVAASSDGTAGSNGNVATFTALQGAALPSGKTPTEAYASLVYQVGNLTANAKAESDATGSTLTQLTNQINSVSGVSIDEESTNLIKYQQAYQAAARVISTVQTLFQVTISMGTGSA